MVSFGGGNRKMLLEKSLKAAVGSDCQGRGKIGICRTADAYEARKWSLFVVCSNTSILSRL